MWDDKFKEGRFRASGRARTDVLAQPITSINETAAREDTCWLPVYTYCNEAKNAYETLCSINEGKPAFLTGGGTPTQDCATYRLVFDVNTAGLTYAEGDLTTLCERQHTTATVQSSGNNTRLLATPPRPGCQEDSVANPGSKTRSVQGYDHSTMSTTLTKRTGYYSDFHLHFHNTASVIGVIPSGGALTSCSLCHGTGTEWDRPLWILTGPTLTITRNFEIAWVSGAKTSIKTTSIDCEY
jgi:hypothetical protein